MANVLVSVAAYENEVRSERIRAGQAVSTATRQTAYDAVFTGLEKGRYSIADGFLGDRQADSDTGPVTTRLDLWHVGIASTSLLQPWISRRSAKA
jgi:hypothetical protein